jgi:two-component system phosphate regulon sensor histidine kinase PhoR
MSAAVLNSLAALIRRDRETLLAEWRNQVRALPSAAHLDLPTLNDHVPALLEELACALEIRSDETIAEALCEGTPPAHGLQRFQDGFNITEVVAEYNILRGCVHGLADANGIQLQGEPFHILNRVLDGAIGLAVDTFATERALEVQRRREEYLAFVAHDLRTPLNAISLAGRVLEAGQASHGGSAESVRVLKTLRRNVVHLEALVGKVLEENSSLETEVGVKLERRDVDLWPLVELLIHDIHPVAGTGSTALINDVPDGLTVYADAGLLRRIFQNLIANAIAYTPRGEVRIVADPLPDGTIQCLVIDNGAGIAAELLETVFEKGSGDPERHESSGLGLTIVKTFVEAHGGTVHADSKEGRGTTIRVTLPPRG